MIWDTVTWERLRVFGRAGGRDWAPALSWCADSRLLAFVSADQDFAAEVWDTEEPRRIRLLLPPDGAGGHLWTLVWSPVGDQLAATYNSGAAVLWELFTGGSRNVTPRRRRVVTRNWRGSPRSRPFTGTGCRWTCLRTCWRWSGARPRRGCGRW